MVSGSRKYDCGFWSCIRRFPNNCIMIAENMADSAALYREREEEEVMLDIEGM